MKLNYGEDGYNVSDGYKSGVYVNGDSVSICGLTFHEGESLEMLPEQKYKKTKMSFNLSNDVINSLVELSDKRGCSMTETLKRCIANEQFFYNIVSSGGKLKFVDKDDKEYIIVFTP